MNKLLTGLLVGLVVGAGGAWLALRPDERPPGGTHPAEAGETKAAANPLRLTAPQREAAGITIGEPKRLALATGIKAHGRVLDPSPLIAALAELEAARAALAASEKEFARVQKLHRQDGNVSAQAVELAEAALLRDRAQATAAQARLVASWGAGLARREDLPSVVSALAENNAALLRLEVALAGPASTSAMPRRALIRPLVGTDAERAAEIIGPAPSTDAASQGIGYLALLRDQPPPPGSAVMAWLEGGEPAQPVLVVPPDAIVYHEGSAWVFTLERNDTFERRRVETGRTTPDGVALLSGIDEHARIAIRGAQQLLSAELQTAIKD